MVVVEGVVSKMVTAISAPLLLLLSYDGRVDSTGRTGLRHPLLVEILCMSNMLLRVWLAHDDGMMSILCCLLNHMLALSHAYSRR